MLYAPNLRKMRQYIFYVPPPPSWVLASAVAFRFCPIQYAFNSTAKPVSCAWAATPQWFQNPHHQAGINGMDGQRTEDGKCMPFKGTTPLSDMLGIAPAGLMSLQIGLRAFLEGHCPSRFQGCLSALAAARFYRISGGTF